MVVNTASSWWMTLFIGTPAQEIPLLPDTGSGDFTVQSTLIPADEQGNDVTYDPSSSSTAFQLSGYTFSECYGSGYCDSGVVYTDTVMLGATAINGVPINAINSVSSISSNSQTGNLGLDFSSSLSSSPGGVGSFLWSIRSSLEGQYYPT